MELCWRYEPHFAEDQGKHPARPNSARWSPNAPCRVCFPRLRALARGARVVLGGKRIDRPGFYLEPTIITDIAEDNPLFQQETFGPIASFYVVENEEEAIRLANATKFGLGASVYSANLERAKRVAGRIESGMVFINSCAYTGPEVPFGGVKNSGFGRELSEYGFGEFVNRKLVRIG